jgi:uncharacterized protein (DUF58 family)
MSGAPAPSLYRFRRFFRWLYRNRSIRLTPEGGRFLLFTVALGVAAINTGNNLLYLLLAMMLSLIVVSGILSEQSLKHIEVRRRIPPHVFAGEPITVTMIVKNRKRALSSFSLRVLDVVEGAPVDRGVHLLRLSPQTSMSQTYPLLLTRRGRHRLDAVRLQTRYPFGLFVKALTIPVAAEIIAYPESKPLPASLLKDLHAVGSDRSVPTRGQGTDLYNLRLYQTGDDSRMIHWMSTARTSRLTVREMEAEDPRRVTIILRTRVTQGERDDFERAVILAAGLTGFYLGCGYAVRAVVGSEVVSHGTGRQHVYRVLRALALCEPEDASTPEPETEPWAELDRPGPADDLAILVLARPDPLATARSGLHQIVVAAAHP